MTTGAVTASSQAAADAGAAALSAGGNAVDAAVAAALASCVADPCNTGIGGYGGYLVVKRPDRAADCVQFPLWAPSTMPPESLARAYPESGPACSAVPNVVGGLSRGLKQFGRLSWAQASAPAIALARDGVVANGTTLRAFDLHRHRPFIAECFVFDHVGTGGRDLLFRQPRLAATLEKMAEHGPEWFYEGPIGLGAVKAWRADGIGVLLDDWKNEAGAVDVNEAPSIEAFGLRVHASPLGLSGSACLFATITAAARIGRRHSLSSPDGLAELAFSMARIWQYRFAMANGNDFSEVDLSAWIEEALAHGAAGHRPDSQTGHTAHLNAVDRDGMLVAVTLTHGPAWFGGRWAIPGTGVIMNGGMHNFTRPAIVRLKSRWIGVSNMTPTIAEAADGDRVAIGCPGARRIPSNIAMALARHAFDGMPLREAVAAGRLHAEDRSCVHFEEDRLGPQVCKALSRIFTEVKREHADNYFGPLTAIRSAARGEVETALDDRDTPGFSAYAV
jgi:gamma-glutamyltranspeptidase/glutathione hydrolase